jgi:Uma2 family endonuclease
MSYPLLKPRRLTVAEFREMELNAPEDERWELINGVIVKSMAGGTLRHNTIVLNIAGVLHAELRRLGSTCRPYTENVRLDSAAANLSTLPDVVVTCTPHAGKETALTDAAAVVEVHSTSSRERDKSVKLDAYLSLPGVRTVLLVEQETMHVVVHTPSERGWLRQEFVAPEDSVTFDGLGVAVTLAQIYEDVAFD